MDEQKEVVRKSNIFIDGQYRFGLHEQKILLMVVSQVRTDQAEFTPYRVDWDEIKRISKGKLDTEKRIDQACQSLKNKTIRLTSKSGKGHDNFGFLSGWTVEPGEYVEFRIDPSMKKMLLGLLERGDFTILDLECALSLPSPHSIRLYEILKSRVWKAQPVRVNLAEIKHNLDVENNKSYINFSNFRTKILDKAQKNLEKYTDIRFTYKTVKKGRKVDAIDFYIKDNKSYQRTIQSEIFKDTVKAGDTILIGEKEYKVHSSGCFYNNGVMPMGELNKLLSEGRIKLLR